MSGGAPARPGGRSRKKRPPRPQPLPPVAPGDASIREALLVLQDRLRDKYGTPRQESFQPPLDEVVFTILSQNTTDTNRDRAWASLWRRFDNWEEIARARVTTIAKAIEIGGLHRTKAQRIKQLLRQLHKQRGDYEFDYLGELGIEEARAELAGYKGVGAKSINCILLFSLRLPAFPVDTHVHRILQRLGIVETRDLGRANRDIQQHVPDEIMYPLHMNVIRYGREVCHARRPKCWACCIEDLCSYDNKNFDP